jgi:hypothetical protein
LRTVAGEPSGEPVIFFRPPISAKADTATGSGHDCDIVGQIK